MTNSGLSCPDWPFCYGLWLPTYSKISLLPDIDYGFDQVIFEWAHRFLAGFLIGGLMLILLFHFSLLYYRKLGDRSLVLSFLLASFLIVIQIILGSFTVFEQNSSWTVALHLLTALLYLVIVWALKIQVELKIQNARDHPGMTSALQRIKLQSSFGMVLLILLMSVGAMMAKSGASLVCPSWPLCEGFSFSEIVNYSEYFTNDLLLLQLTHRILSFLFLCNSIILWKMILNKKSVYLSKCFTWCMFFIFLQVVLGGALIFFAIPFGLNIIHLILSLIILSLFSSVHWRLVFNFTE